MAMAHRRNSSSAASDSIGDLTERLWKNFRILSNAPMKFRPACKDIISMLGAWHLLQDSILKYPTAEADNGNLSHFVNSCNSKLEELEGLITQYKFHRDNFNVDEIMALQTRLAKETDEVLSFYKILRSRTRESIIEALGKIPFSISHSNPSTFDTPKMSIVQKELPQQGISEDLVDQEFFFIEDWLQSNFPAGATFATEDKDVEELEESLPDYKAGPAREAIEKVQALENTSSRMAIGSFEASSSVDPPAYTFEEGGDELMDDEFSRDVQSAIVIELMTRSEHRKKYPELGVRPWAWLPMSYQKAYMDSSRGVIQMLTANSFSVMAYETSMRYLDNIARVKQLLATTKGSSAEAQRSLEVMTGALTKFAILQNQRNDQPFSDLDILDFEYSTAQAVGSVIQQFPATEFELAQKSYYRLLTYIMGFVSAMSNIYTGRTAVIRSSKEIEDLWKSKNMSAHTAWVEKQLTQWDAVEDSVFYCRDWHRTQLTLRSQALTALKDWKSAEEILSGVQGTDTIELTVVSASEIPKSKLRSPSPWLLLVIYEPNKFGGAMRVREWKTEPVQKSQFPVWNKSFSIDVPNQARWIDIEVFDRVAGLTATLTRRPIRLPFSWIPGVEANFADKSLIYDYDEEMDIPIQLDTKGKETQPAILKIRLQWKGRISKVEALGLPIRGPGKMFRSDAFPVPFPPEEINVTLPAHEYPARLGAPPTYDPYGQN